MSALSSDYGPDSLNPYGPEARHREVVGGMIAGVVFIAALAGTYALIMISAAENLLGIRGKALADNPFAYERQDIADLATVSAVAVLVVIATVLQKKLHLPRAAVYGAWTAIALGMLIIAIR